MKISGKIEEINQALQKLSSTNRVDPDLLPKSPTLMIALAITKKPTLN